MGPKNRQLYAAQKPTTSKISFTPRWKPEIAHYGPSKRQLLFTSRQVVISQKTNLKKTYVGESSGKKVELEISVMGPYAV